MTPVPWSPVLLRFSLKRGSAIQALTSPLGVLHRVGESLLNDMAAISLEDPSQAEDFKADKVPALAFGAVAQQQHKWQVRYNSSPTCLSALQCHAASASLFKSHAVRLILLPRCSLLFWVPVVVPGGIRGVCRVPACSLHCSSSSTIAT